MNENRPTVEEMRDRFRYDTDTGKLYHRSGPRAGKEAFTADSAGYTRGRAGYYLTSGHLAAWVISYGYWPADHGLVVDHINGDPADNRICNLRAVPTQENLRNRHAPAKGVSGHVGVYPHGAGKWAARIRVGGKLIALGLYEDKRDAVIARAAAEKALGFHAARNAEARSRAPLSQAGAA